ncbi:MAG TPA: hypothetical protein PLJ21_05485 [Pseudobdellovibrionaceae bacterium]|nr:hypothetical protein [Pseudobdellovibrionaceae bacterium]
MKLSNADIETLKTFEESPRKSETRFNLVHQEKVFAPDFFEFGRSGRRYTREQMVRTDARCGQNLYFVFLFHFRPILRLMIISALCRFRFSNLTQKLAQAYLASVQQINLM